MVPANEENLMTQPVIFISQEVLSDSLSEVGNADTFSSSIVALIDGGFDVAIGPEFAPTKLFTDSGDFYAWFSDLQDGLNDDPDSEPDADDPQLDAIEHEDMLIEMGLPADDDSLSPKGMDQAEVRAGLRDPD
jgi:hypothetical protein